MQQPQSLSNWQREWDLMDEVEKIMLERHLRNCDDEECWVCMLEKKK